MSLRCELHRRGVRTHLTFLRPQYQRALEAGRCFPTMDPLAAHKVKNLPAMQSDAWVPRVPWRREMATPPVFFLENFMDREAWWATVHESDTAEGLTNTHKGGKAPEKLILPGKEALIREDAECVSQQLSFPF